MHPPKVETFDVPKMINVDPKGFYRAVDRYDVHPFGLYMARASDHPSFHYLESWLLPSLRLRASVFHFTPGNERDQDLYLDIGEFGREDAGTWRSVDHYLDVVVRTGRDAELIDVDELALACATGVLSAEHTQQAIETATALIDGLARNDYDFGRWLGTHGIAISWAATLPVH